MGSPLISVLMPVYNGEKYLAEAIESILNQTFRDFELIAIDDASTDSTWKIINSYADSRLIKLQNEKNLGVNATTNRGIQQARGEFIVKADADDVSYPDRFERQVNFFQNHPEIGVVAGSIQRINADGEKIGTPTIPIQEPYLIKFWLTFESVLNQPAVMMRKAILNQVGNYDPNYRAGGDYELWTRLANATLIANLAGPLVYYRVHGQSITFTLTGSQKNTHLLVCQHQIERLTRHLYSEDSLLPLFTKDPLSASQTRKLIAIYRSCVNTFIKNENLNQEQQRRLLYTLSWRINYLYERTAHPILIWDELLKAYLHNKDLFAKRVRSLLRK